MGVMLREVLRAFCSSNQWSYAIFWKIGCQNTSLLIWEECYYEPTQCSELPFGEWENCWGSSETNSSQLGPHSLVNKLMMNNQINLVGEGIVGRAAFTGNHQWILANNYIADAHPPEVQNEVQVQFSAGMQTVVVIPVLPHGVVQLGSSSAMMENIGFVNYVRSLIMQLGSVPGALLSENYESIDSSKKQVSPLSDGIFVSEEPSGSCDMSNSIPSLGENGTHHNFSYQHLGEVGELLGSLGLRHNNQTSSTHTLSRAEVIPSNSDAWLNQQSSLYNSRPGFNYQPSMWQSSVNGRSSKEKQIVIDDAVNGFDNNKFVTSHLEKNGGSATRNSSDSRKERMDDNLFQALNNPFSYSNEHISLGEKIPSFTHDSGGVDPESSNSKFEVGHAQNSSGDDLFDILGADFKNKLLSGSWNNNMHDDRQNPSKEAAMSINVQDVSSDFYLVNEGTEHLLDAVVSRAYSSSKQISDDNLSCKTTLTKVSSSPIPISSTSCGQFNMPHALQGEFYGFPKTTSKAAATVGSSYYKSGCSKDDTGSCSQTSSIYGSHVSSWVDQGRDVKCDSSVSTAYSKKNDQITKSNRKRLKPGENPRPRPKDRQMIQDRVKELREIVPNGAKCSIDALLERTIKHMLFLQSVTKHADKLKQTGESKIINKEGGLLSKDNFDVGATWAFEVGSQSMLCPIIVEDLNPPRQMLVEMLCEERGFFLEIADLIRGMGLTILKGVMEARNDKIWARFAVEANRDVTRMEIFMSLVQLLEQTVKGSSFTNALDSNNMMVHHSFPQATSIPATGMPSSLQ